MKFWTNNEFAELENNHISLHFYGVLIYTYIKIKTNTLLFLIIFIKD